MWNHCTVAARSTQIHEHAFAHRCPACMPPQPLSTIGDALAGTSEAGGLSVLFLGNLVPVPAYVGVKRSRTASAGELSSVRAKVTALVIPPQRDVHLSYAHTCPLHVVPSIHTRTRAHFSGKRGFCGAVQPSR